MVTERERRWIVGVRRRLSGRAKSAGELGIHRDGSVGDGGSGDSTMEGIRLGGEEEVFMQRGGGEENASNWPRGREILSKAGLGVGVGLELRKRRERERGRHRELAGWGWNWKGDRWDEDWRRNSGIGGR